MSARKLGPWMAVALTLHGAAFAAYERRPVMAAPPKDALEIDLAALSFAEPVPTAPSPALPPGEAARSEPAGPPVPVAPASRSRLASPAVVPAAAKAGRALTVGDAEGSDPVSFVSDPNGGTYGFGVVARGGTAEHGLGTGVATAPAASANAAVDSGADRLTPASDLSQKPHLDEADACRGFFPGDATADVATVDLTVVVQASGRVTRASIARESAPGEGFGAAARACLLAKHFVPGVDRQGRAVPSSAAVRVHFTR